MIAPICLLTRPEPQAREFAEMLPGVEVLISPVLRIVPVEFDRTRVEAAPGLVFTSMNAVAFAGKARNRPALCVGPGTAEAARRAGFAAILGPGNAAGLVPLLKERQDWLHLHGRHLARVLPVPGIAVYDQRAVPLDAKGRAVLGQDRPVILPLFSPRSADLSANATRDAVAPIAVVAINAHTADCYTGPALQRRIAARPDREAMAEAVMALISGERSQSPWVEAERGGR